MHAIQINDLIFRWKRDGATVLSLDAIRIARGEQVFISGPSGSGKSTLLSLLAGVTTAQQGSLQVLGNRLERLGGVERDHFRANHIGYIFQMFNLIPYLSMVDNVTLPCRFSRQRRDKAVKRSGTPEREAIRLLDHLDMAHDDLLGRPVTTLSVGQQQRVAAARALMGSPEIVIADEPTSSLDANRREAFVQLLFNECGESGATLVFVSHDESLEPLFERRIPLKEANRAAHPETRTCR
ncbi:MAG: ABC transporter ATP-binding protein [Gammaproteobacteria bacterium]|nr:ABC transporter ATP-binding protein [Gammaproteobacteria bacterium]